MPNHVTNVIKADAKVLRTFVRCHTVEELTTHAEAEKSRRKKVEERGGKFVPDIPNPEFVDFGTIIPIPDDDDPRITATKSDYGSGMVGWSMDGMSPMDFARDLWGTKWNAYGQKLDSLDDGIVQFDTAWSHPLPVIHKLSTLNPDEVIEVMYADEDFGYNLAHYRIKNGEVIEILVQDDGSPEALELAAKVNYGMTYEEVKKMWDEDES